MAVPRQHLASPMDSGQLSFAALLAGALSRWRLAVTVATGTIVLAVGLTFIVPPSYRATATFVTTDASVERSEEHTSELQSRLHLVCRLLLEKKKKKHTNK